MTGHRIETVPGALDGKVLIVDDEHANVQLLEDLLTRSGYRNLRSTTDPTEVVSLYLDFEPDLVLLDLKMPVLSGFDILQGLSEHIDPDDYLPILILTVDASQQSKQRALAGGAKDFLIKPFDATEALLRVGNLLDARYLHLQLRRSNELLEVKVKERTEELWNAIGELQSAEQDLHLAQEETIHRLSLAAEFRDDETSRHLERMSRYCAILAKRQGEDERRCALLRIASKMHDVGKIGIPDSILLKPHKLTEEEFDVIRRHPGIGYEILCDSQSELVRTAAMIAWTHHEKVDGSGYPRGLKGEEIPLEGRIAAVADVFDALTTDRVYRKAFTLPQALKIMREGQGTHFDIELLNLFLGSLDTVLAAKQEFDEAPIH